MKGYCRNNMFDPKTSGDRLLYVLLETFLINMYYKTIFNLVNSFLISIWFHSVSVPL